MNPWYRPEDVNTLLREALDGVLLAQELIHNGNEGLAVDELEIAFSHLKLLQEAISESC